MPRSYNRFTSSTGVNGTKFPLGIMKRLFQENVRKEGRKEGMKSGQKSSRREGNKKDKTEGRKGGTVEE